MAETGGMDADHRVGVVARTRRAAIRGDRGGIRGDRMWLILKRLFGFTPSVVPEPPAPPRRLMVPFDDATVAALIRWQNHPQTHPFTCGVCGCDLSPERDGLRCETVGCNFVQRWAPSYVLEERPRVVWP